jgi:hypothetical protein
VARCGSPETRCRPSTPQRLSLSRRRSFAAATFSCAGSFRPGPAAEPTAVGLGTRRWSIEPDREPSSPFGNRLPKRTCWRSECDHTAPSAHPGRSDPKRFAAGSHAAPLALVPLHVLRPGNRSQALPSPCEKSELREHRQREPVVSGEPAQVLPPRRVRSLHASLPTQDNNVFLTDLRRKCLRRAARHPALTSPHVEPEGHARTETAGDSRAGPMVLQTIANRDEI